MKRMDSELRQLFGETITRQARQTDPAMLDLSANLMDRVHDAADALLCIRGDIEGQKALVVALPFNVRLVLCMWLMDTGLATKLARAATGKQVCR